MPQSISRRTWIGGSITGIAGLGLGTSFADDSKSTLDIIDCHTHFYDPTRPEGIPWPGKGGALYRTVLPKHLRTKAVSSGHRYGHCRSKPAFEDNTWLLELAKDDPFVVGIVGNLTPGTADFAEHVKKFAANPLFRGIRISSRLLNELVMKQTLADLKLLADHDLALDVNGGPDSPAIVAKFAPLLPELRIVQNHIGNVRITADGPPREWQEGIQAAAQHPNVFCKISALVEGARDGQKAPDNSAFYKPYIDVVWNAFGDDRVIYGSNWPVSERAADYETLQRIAMEYAFQKGPEATAKFCSLNAKRAYKWVDRPGRR